MKDISTHCDVFIHQYSRSLHVVYALAMIKANFHNFKFFFYYNTIGVCIPIVPGYRSTQINTVGFASIEINMF